MMSKAGFNLRSWNSNSIKVRQQAVSQTVLDTDTDTKVLGMRWNSNTDYLFYPHKCKEEKYDKTCPHWLTDSSTYPKSTSIDTSLSVLLTENESTCISQSKDDSVCQFGINFIIDIERYSSYQKLLRITSYVLRFIENCRIEKSLRTLEHLKPSELSKSVELWIRNCQETAFATEYNALKYNNIETSKDEEARQKKEPSATTSRILPNREAATRARENIKKWTK
ncbi:Hypothetical predicted protein [Mytilus galloprovincialis]|uniref:Uncharacterized protein n=1 Tax=Mytilus galloprovincialis TaxID=29158 RepID=A0A8B6GLV3_MYTGA|nr:Hypothetical predicted protein [Mytilus galloprovincialis]